LDVCPHTAQANDNGNLLSYDEYAGGPGFAQSAHVNQTFAYDGVNRLIMAQETGSWGPTFDYDQWGNIAVTTPNNVVPLNVNTATSLSQYNANNQRSDSGQGYDAAGNQTLMNPQITLTYDAENRQTAAGGYTYTYDGDGRRVMKTGGGVTTVFVYDAMGELSAEYSNAANTSSCSTCYLSYDHLGTTRLVTNASGQVVSRHDYLPFGEEITGGVGGRDGTWGSGADGVNQKFTGKERDAETQLDYFGARYYGSALGRFTSADRPFADQHPEDPQSWNLYAYVRSNPLKNTDPNGRDCTDGVSSCLNYIAGGLMAIGNIPSEALNAPNHIANALISPFTDYRFSDLVSPTLTPSNVDQQQGMNAANAIMLVTPVAEAGAAKAAEAIGAITKIEAAGEAATATTEVPTSIPAGPSARPTAAQQKAINEMGDAHGCNTCGATTPGTKSGNWVGDHQPPTALNTSGGPQVYQPQCLQCSRQQGGQVAAAARAAKKAACSSGSSNCQ
jgi:RHS repeat-associated protein